MNSNMILSCRETRQDLTAYLHGELPSHRRTQIARHLLTCPDCDALYHAHQTVSRELRATVPLVGGGNESGRFEWMWREIAAQLASPRAQMNTSRLATSAVALLVGIVLALAWSPKGVNASVPTPPTAVVGSDSANGTPIAAAFTSLDRPRAEATETPRLQSNYAPAAGSTDTP